MNILKKIFLLIGYIFCQEHKCVHHEIIKDITLMYRDGEPYRFKEKKKLKPYDESDGEFIKLHINYDNLAGIEDVYRDAIENQLMPVAQEFFQKRLKINKFPGKTKLPRNLKKCNQADIAEKYYEPGIFADLIIFATYQDLPTQTFIAWAAACALDNHTNRPIAGQINFNVGNFKPQILSQRFAAIGTVIHELTHVFAFSNLLFDKYVDSQGYEMSKDQVIVTSQEGQYKRNSLKTKNIVNFARFHFDCMSIDRVYLENDGPEMSAGQHFEQVLVFNEVMTSYQLQNQIYSGFSFALLQDSGWYGVEWQYVERLYAGRKRGCDWYKSCHSPTKYPEFCTNPGAQGCNFDFSSVGYCQDLQSKKDNCYTIKPYANMNCFNSYDAKKATQKAMFGEKTSQKSHCFHGNLMQDEYEPLKGGRFGCYESGCIENDTKIAVQVGDDIQVCTKLGQELSFKGFQGTLSCPNPKDFCQYKYIPCKNFCNARGYCLNGECDCLDSFDGDDCSESNGTYEQLFQKTI